MPPVIPPITFPVFPTIVLSTGDGSLVASAAIPTPPLFMNQPTVVIGPHISAIQATAENMEGLAPNLRARLADAYLTADNAGSLQQLYTAKAVEQLFLVANGLDAGETALTVHLHQGISDALRSSDEQRGQDRLHGIFRTMEAAPQLDLSSLETLDTLIESGHDPETIVTRLAGTRHTAFIKNPAVSDALVSLLIEDRDCLDSRYERRRNVHGRNLLGEIGRRVDAGESLTGEALRQILRSSGFEVPSSLPILIKTGAEFDADVSDWGAVVGREGPYGCRRTIYRRVKGNGEIWVRDIEETARDERVWQWMTRLIAITHETEHAGQADFSDRIVSEVLAGLAEQRWRMRNYDIDGWISASRMRLNIVQYLKLMAMRTYRLIRTS